jgi:hypothetical protein
MQDQPETVEHDPVRVVCFQDHPHRIYLGYQDLELRSDEQEAPPQAIREVTNPRPGGFAHDAAQFITDVKNGTAPVGPVRDGLDPVATWTRTHGVTRTMTPGGSLYAKDPTVRAYILEEN